MKNRIISAIIITGGYGASKSVEVLKEDGSYWCSLPDLPNNRYHHTQSGLILCGGKDTRTSCLTFTGGQWTQSYTLQFNRWGHSKWLSTQGVMLLGGAYYATGTTTEILTNSGQSTQSFNLTYSTR